MSSSTSATRPTTRTLQILPVEIWTIILESTIHIPRLFDTTCTDVSFAQYKVLGSRLFDGEAAYRESECQRLILRNVCSAWRGWADSRKNRYIVTKDTDIPFEVVLKAVRVPLLASVVPTELEIRHDEPSRWRIIDAQMYLTSHALCFKDLSLHANEHPLLRRINLSVDPRMEELSEVIRCLGAFKSINYLSLDLRLRLLSGLREGYIQEPPKKKDSNAPTCIVTLPNVRVLEYLAFGDVPTTFTLSPTSNDSSVLSLPQLEHFYFYGRLPGRRLVFEWLTAFTLRGLKSLTLGGEHAPDIKWSELPNLEELACLNREPMLLEPIPKMHPLQRVWLFARWSLEMFDALTAGLEAGNGANLRMVRLRRLRWDQEGRPVPTPRKTRGGPIADDEARDKFCDQVDRFGELYGLRTLDRHGCTRDDPYQRSAPISPH
jgi:hypothetical protein